MEAGTPRKPTVKDLLPASFLQQAISRAPKLLQLNRPAKGIAIYCRRSTDIENDSIERQIDRGTEYAERRFKAPIDYKYADAGISGEVRERDGLSRLLKDAEAGLFNVVIVEEVDRLGRTMAIIADIHDRLEKLGVRVHSVSKGDVIETIDIAFKGFMASEHQVLLRARSKAGKQRAVEAGKIVTKLPFGYVKDYLRPGQCSIDSAKMPVIRWMYEARAAGMTLQAIARGANKRLGQTLIHRVSLAYILRNPIYKGVYTFRRSVAAARRDGKRVQVPRHPDEWMTVVKPELRMVDEDLWDHVVKGLTKRGRPGGARLLSGKCVCRACGNRMVVRDNKFIGKVYYRCYQNEYDPKSIPQCKGGLIGAEDIERLCLDAIRDVLSCDQLESEFQRMVEEEFARNIAALGPRRKELGARKEKLEAQLNKELENVALQNFPAELVQQRHRKMTEEWEQLDAELTDMPDIDRRFIVDNSRKVRLLEAFDRVCNTLGHDLRRHDTDSEEALAALRNLIAGVQITRILGSRSYRCTISIAADAIMGAAHAPGCKPSLHRRFEHIVHRPTDRLDKKQIARAYENRSYFLNDGEFSSIIEAFGSEIAKLIITSELNDPRKLLDILAFLATTSTTRPALREILGLPWYLKIVRRINTTLTTNLWNRISEFLQQEFPERRHSFNPKFRDVWMAWREK
ncbi:recombinase family protein [Bosea sp. 685]|uniref:recombinase family protein n=1 Tax=Bosea sp. 685 TaxID=3080057 RepID=UPI0028936677|nr:recombinase family protein [Bosea sp. 685]WNJ89577.1 recombinase family protein [Bosea sp. 685]